jgi:hypothetical protein
MFEMQQQISQCTNAAGNLWGQLRQNSNLSSIIRIPATRPASYAFRVQFLGPNLCGKFDSLSISFPSDIYDNRGPNPSTIETALFKNGSLVYVNSIGYDDVSRFYSINELVEEIQRLHTIYSSEYVQSNEDNDSSHSDSHSDSDSDRSVGSRSSVRSRNSVGSRSSIEARSSSVEARSSSIEARSSSVEARSSSIEARSSVEARSSSIEARSSVEAYSREASNDGELVTAEVVIAEVIVTDSMPDSGEVIVTANPVDQSDSTSIIQGEEITIAMVVDMLDRVNTASANVIRANEQVVRANTELSSVLAESIRIADLARRVR